MKTQITRLMIVTALSINTYAAEDPVYFSDAMLKAAVESQLGPNPTPTDMLGLTSLTSTHTVNNGIKSLTGLEYATNLSSLILSYNEISSLSPLSGLVNLETLILNDNKINSLSPIANLVKLEKLDIHNNQISSISALAGLVNLETLILYKNDISSISALSGLTNLQLLKLNRNDISTISSLSGLTNLKSLYLSNNQITSVSPISNLNNLTTLHLNYNQITNISPLLNLTNLTSLNIKNNYPLNDQAYCLHLDMIIDNNPPICLDYSSNHNPVTGISASDGIFPAKVRITWDTICNGPSYTSYYQVSRASAPNDPKTPISQWQRGTTFEDMTALPGIKYYYWVQTATSIQGSDKGMYSIAETGTAGSEERPYTLILSSTGGGAVVTPGEGTYQYRHEERVVVTAETINPDLYTFAGWIGSAVEAGQVENPNEASTVVTMKDNYTLKAYFTTVMNTLFVDNEASEDPGSTDVNIYDPYENGTLEHPFDTIQEAIEVAPEGASIIIYPGTYEENINLSNKHVKLIGMDSNTPDFPLIKGDNIGSVITLNNSQDANCVLSGLNITGGNTGIHCIHSSSTIKHCIVEGINGPGILCQDSNAVIINCTVSSNNAALVSENSHVRVSNCILWNNNPQSIIVTLGTDPLITYSNIQELDISYAGNSNKDTDPLFADPGYWDNNNTPEDPNDDIWMIGDYHLQSQAGRWDPITQTWGQDEQTSPCIDAGDPNCPVDLEPIPHGDIINMGAYGSTIQASKSTGD